MNTQTNGVNTMTNLTTEILEAAERNMRDARDGEAFPLNMIGSDALEDFLAGELSDEEIVRWADGSYGE
jgi:hypothetical protein